jgi:hypothetical protein
VPAVLSHQRRWAERQSRPLRGVGVAFGLDRLSNGQSFSGERGQRGVGVFETNSDVDRFRRSIVVDNAIYVDKDSVDVELRNDLRHVQDYVIGLSNASIPSEHSYGTQ